MAVLDLIKKVKVQTLSFEKHPCRDLDMETKIHYLNALALVANEDGKIDEKEEEYLTILINSFELSEDTLNEYLEFAKNPDESRLVEMMNAFGTKDIKYNLMVDAMMIAQRDGSFDESEKALIEQYFEMFKISKKEAQDLEYIFKMFYEQDARALSRYFNRHRMIKQSLFQYLIEYYKIDLEYAFKEEEKELLTFQWFTPTFEAGCLKDAKEIMKKPISNAQFFIYLNAKYDDDSISVKDNRVIFNDEEKTLLIDLEHSDIGFKDSDFFIEDSTKDDEKITGITEAAVNDFLEWINTVEDTEYKLVEFYASKYGRLWIVHTEDLTTVFQGKEFYKDGDEIRISQPLKDHVKEISYISFTKDDTMNTFSFRLMR